MSVDLGVPFLIVAEIRDTVDWQVGRFSKRTHNASRKGKHIVELR